MLSEDFEKVDLWLKKTSAPYEVVAAVSRIKKDRGRAEYAHQQRKPVIAS